MTVGSPIRAIDPSSVRPSSFMALLLMHALHRGTIVSQRASSNPFAHSVRNLEVILLRHAVVRAVESHVRDTVVALDAGGFLKTLGNIGADFTENGNLALEDFFLGACGHVAGDVADKALAGLFVPDTFPQGAGSVEIFGTDFTQESDGVRGEVAVNFVKVDGAVLETDRFNRRQIIGAGTLVEESHVPIALKVAHAVIGSG